MSDTVIMRHPTLPADQEIEVPQDSVPHYTGAGWQMVPAEELEHRAALKAQAEAEAAAAEEAAQLAAEGAADAQVVRAEEPAAPETADEPEQSEPADTPTKPSRTRAKPKTTEEN